MCTMSGVPDATLQRRQKQRNYSHVKSDRRGTRRMEASALACQAKALQHSLANEALSISRAGFGREFDERIALPNGRDAPMT